MKSGEICTFLAILKAILLKTSEKMPTDRKSNRTSILKNIERSIRYEKISRLIEFFDYRTSLIFLVSVPKLSLQKRR